MTAGERLVGALLVTVLVFAAAVLLDRGRRPEAPTVSGMEGTPTPDPPSVDTPTPSATAAPELPTSPEEAEELGAERLLAAGFGAARGPWRELGDPAWAPRERPVYVARVELDGRRHVEVDVAIGVRAESPLDELVLRLLPAADALGDNGLEARVRRDGERVDARLDREGARLLVLLDPPLAAGDATVVRVQLSYRVTDRTAIVDDGGPAGFGLLAWNADATFLGHWLPLLTTDPGPMLALGDVGAFPVALWSVVVHAGAHVVSGGSEDECPRPADDCTWLRGVALRDVSAVAYDDVEAAEAEPVEGFRVNAVAPRGAGIDVRGTLAVASSAVDSFARRFGPLAWSELDVAAVPLGEGAAGMEFPGLIAIDTDVYADIRGTFGRYVVAHEVGHQWFHALVGNSSLESPVVDESIAQYLTYLNFADELGDRAARAFAEQAMVGRYARARADGLEDEPPAQPLWEFDDSDAYGALVYGRAAIAWIIAEDEVGRDTVVRFLSTVVDRWALDDVSDDELLAYARQRSPGIAAILDRIWFDPEPLPAG